MKKVAIAGAGCALMLIASATMLQADLSQDLLEGLDKAKSTEQRVALVNRIGLLGRHGQGAIPVLETLLRDSKQEVANQAARSLAQIGAASAPALTTALNDEDPAVSWRALWALCVLGPNAAESVPKIVPLLEHPNERFRVAAIFTLGEIGPLTDDAAGAVVKAMRTRAPMVRFQAILAIRKAGMQVLPELEWLFLDDDADTRAAAGYAVSLFGNKAKAMIPTLEMSLEDADKNVREAAAYALGSMEQAAANSLPKLIDLIQDPEYDVQAAAFRAAIAVGINDPRLLKALREANAKGKWAVPFMLREFAKNPEAAVDHVVKKLEQKDAGQRLSAAWALGQIGLPARDAIPALEKLLKDPLPQNRVMAFMALRQIKKEAFEHDHPLIKEWNDAIERQMLQLAEHQRQLEAQFGGKRFQMSLQNFQIKRFYDQLVQLHVFRSLTKKKPAPMDIDQMLDRAGAEALTSMVQEVNKIAGLNIGFT